LSVVPCQIIDRGKGDMLTDTSDFRQYTKQLLDLYLHTPGTLGHVRREDRRLAVELHHRGVSLRTVEEAFLLAAARRCLRAPDAPPLAPVRSLHYFVPVIEELLATPLPDGYCDYLRRKLKTIHAAHDDTVTRAGCKPDNPG
jgi:hypothetical protein